MNIDNIFLFIFLILHYCEILSGDLHLSGVVHEFFCFDYEIRGGIVLIKKMHNKIEKMGIRPERLQLEWISAAEGMRFARVMNDMERLRQNVTEAEIIETIRILEERKNKKSVSAVKGTA